MLEAASTVGRILGQYGVGLISGGRGGVMGAAARAHADAGGFSIGILPGVDDDDANRFNTVNLPSGIGFARNLPNVLAGHAVVVVGGGPGTLTELGYALQFQRPLFLCAWTGGVCALTTAAIQAIEPTGRLTVCTTLDQLTPDLDEWLRDLEGP